MQHYFEKSNDISQLSGSDKERSFPASPISSGKQNNLSSKNFLRTVFFAKRRKLSLNNGQLSDLILLYDQNDEKQFHDLILREEYLKIQNPLSQGRNYAKSVTKRRTPISFQMRGSSCQKTREDKIANGKYTSKNYINLLSEKDRNSNEGVINKQKQTHTAREGIAINKQSQDKKKFILPKCFDEEHNSEVRNGLQDRVKGNSPERGNTNSPLLSVQQEFLFQQQIFRKGEAGAGKAKTETFRQTRLKKKPIESSFLTGKREGNITANSISVTNASKTNRNLVIPIIETNENHLQIAPTPKVMQSVNPRTLPFLSSERACLLQTSFFPMGEIKTCTNKGSESLMNHLVPATSKNYHSSNAPTSQSVTTTITYNSQGSNTLGSNLPNKINLHQINHNTICTNQIIKPTKSRYSSHTPSKRIGGIIMKALEDTDFTKESSKLQNRNSQLRRRQYNNVKQNNILVNSLQNVQGSSSMTNQDNVLLQISQTPNANMKVNTIATTTIESNPQHQSMSINNNLSNNNINTQNLPPQTTKLAHLQNSPIQQAFNKTQFNKIVVNFSSLRRDGQDIGKGFFGSVLNNIPKHPLFKQISTRQAANGSEQKVQNSVYSNNMNEMHSISSLLEKGAEHKIISTEVITSTTNSLKSMESVEGLVDKINTKLKEVQANLSKMKSSNQMLLDAIGKEEKGQEKGLYLEQALSLQSTELASINSESRIELSQLIPLFKQCFNSSPNDINNPSCFDFLETDNEDSELEEICTV